MTGPARRQASATADESNQENTTARPRRIPVTEHGHPGTGWGRRIAIALATLAFVAVVVLIIASITTV